MTKWIIIAILIALSILFACLKAVWTGFVFFVVACLCLLCFYLMYLQIRKYIKDYHTDFDKIFIGYKAEYVNANNITSEEFESNKEFHIKAFKKLLRREKAIDIFKILFILSLVVAAIIAIIRL